MHIETAFRSLCDGFTSFIFLFSSSSFSSQVGNFPFLYIQYAPRLFSISRYSSSPSDESLNLDLT